MHVPKGSARDSRAGFVTSPKVNNQLRCVFIFWRDSSQNMNLCLELPLKRECRW